MAKDDEKEAEDQANDKAKEEAVQKAKEESKEESKWEWDDLDLFEGFFDDEFGWFEVEELEAQ